MPTLDGFSAALRPLTRRPISAIAIVLTLALGIGANMAGLSVLHAVLLRPLSVDAEDQLVVVREIRLSEPDSAGASYLNFRDWAAGARAFDGLALVGEDQARVTTDGIVRIGDSLVVSQGLFRTIGVRAALGATLDGFPDDGLTPSGARPVMLTHRGWQEWFGGAADVVGRAVLVDGMPGEIVGVTASNVFPLAEDPVHFWTTPVAYGRASDPDSVNGSRNFRQYAGVVGRLKAGVTPAAAQADIERVSRQIAETAPAAMKDRGVRVDGLRALLMADATRPAWLATALVVLIWCITCVNVVNLQVARAVARHRDLSVRRALGASRWQIVQLFLIENLTLGLTGGLLGLALAAWVLRVASPLIPPDAGVPAVSLDFTLGLVCVGLSLFTGLICGAGPAWAATRRLATRLAPTDGRSPATLVPRPLRHTLVAAEMAFAIILLTLGGLFTNSLYRLERSTPGFTLADVWMTRVTASSARQADIETTLRRQPGVATVAFAQSVPYTGADNSTGMSLDGPLQTDGPSVQLRFVSPEFFDVMGIPSVDGRVFSATDTSDAPAVALVNAAFVKAHSNDRTAIGRIVRLGWGGNAPKRIVGVVGDVRHRDPGDAPRPEVYVPLAQFPSATVTALWRMAPGGVLEPSTVHTLLRSLEPGMPLLPVRSLESYRAATLSTPRLGAGVLGGLALLCLALAGIGLYGVTSHVTALRTHEVGVRMALGATRRNIIWMVAHQAVSPAAAGAVAGLLVASMAAGSVRSWLYGVEPSDPLTMATAFVVLIGVATLAGIIPARRAAATNPIVALRSE